MNGDDSFVDYYAMLQVHPECDAKMLESAYRHLAKIYHPDHSGAEDITRFSNVTKAYNALRHPEQRAEYDLVHAKTVRPDPWTYPVRAEAGADEDAALSDADAHAKILMYLYAKRREHAQRAGVVGYHLQETVNCSDEHFEFHMWYLKEKGLIAITDQGTLAITIQGVDHVIAMSRTSKAERLLIAQSPETPD